MRFRRTSLWALIDVLGVSLGVALLSVHPKAESKGVEKKAELLLTATWDTRYDADVDLWHVAPDGRPTFYSARDVGCARYEQDDRGYLDGHVTLADGTQAAVPAFTETITLRCIEPGRHDAAVHLYAYRDKGLSALPTRRGLAVRVHIELIALNPSYRVLDAKDVTLDHVSQSVNALSFELARDGTVTLAEPPLGLVVEKFQRANP